MDTGNNFRLSQQIDAYLAGELPKAEATAFEQKMAQDPTLQAQVQEQRDLTLMLTYIETERLQKLAKKRSTELKKNPLVQLQLYWNRFNLQLDYWAYRWRKKSPSKPTPSLPLFPFLRYALPLAVLFVVGIFVTAPQNNVPILVETPQLIGINPTRSSASPTISTKIEYYFEAAQYDSARFYLQQLPDSVLEKHLVWFNIGISYLNEEKGKEAVEAFEKAQTLQQIKQQEDNDDIKLNLARAYLQVGDKDKAKPILKDLSKKGRTKKYKREANRLLKHYWWFERW